MLAGRPRCTRFLPDSMPFSEGYPVRSRTLRNEFKPCLLGPTSPLRAWITSLTRFLGLDPCPIAKRIRVNALRRFIVFTLALIPFDPLCRTGQMKTKKWFLLHWIITVTIIQPGPHLFLARNLSVSLAFTIYHGNCFRHMRQGLYCSKGKRKKHSSGTRFIK